MLSAPLKPPALRTCHAPLDTATLHVERAAPVTPRIVLSSIFMPRFTWPFGRQDVASASRCSAYCSSTIHDVEIVRVGAVTSRCGGRPAGTYLRVLVGQVTALVRLLDMQDIDRELDSRSLPASCLRRNRIAAIQSHVCRNGTSNERHTHLHYATCGQHTVACS